MSYNIKNYNITTQELRQRYHYDPATGIVTWKAGYDKGRGGYRRKPGTEVGHAQGNGLYTEVNHVSIPLRRLIWWLVKGYLPSYVINHANGDRFDNRWVNLRLNTKHRLVDTTVPAAPALSYEEAIALFSYNPRTGKLFRRISSANNRPDCRAGSEAGVLNRTTGYMRVQVGPRKYAVHRLAWLITYGYLPEGPVDHIDRDKTNNRLDNLREVSTQCNNRNAPQQKNNSVGVKGIHFCTEKKKYVAQIKNGGHQQCYLGAFDDLHEAVYHRLAAEQCLGWAGCDSTSPAFMHAEILKLF